MKNATRCTYRLMSAGRFFHTYNVVTIVAWAGVGKSTVVNHWLGRMASEHYRLQSLFLAGPSTDRAPAETLRPQMNFLMRLSIGLEIQIHGSERRGRRARDSRSSSRIVEPYWFSMAWSRSKIRLVRKKAGFAILRSRRFCASLLPLI